MCEHYILNDAEWMKNRDKPLYLRTDAEQDESSSTSWLHYNCFFFLKWMMWFVITVCNCSFPHCNLHFGIFKGLPFLWITAEVAFCHQCVSYNKEAGEEEVAGKLCPCCAAGIFQESTASSLAFSILDNIVEMYSKKRSVVCRGDFQTFSKELHYQMW